MEVISLQQNDTLKGECKHHITQQHEAEFDLEAAGSRR